MHHQVKKSAINKYAPLLAEGKPADEIKAAIAADEKKFTPEEVEEIFQALGKPADENDAETEPEVPKTGNASLDLSRFNYGNMVGQPFLDYMELIDSLPMHEKYDFEQYKVSPVVRERFPGMKNTPIDVIGFTIRDNAPVKTTRILPAHARDNNGRIMEKHGFKSLVGAQWDKNGGNPNSYGLIYLLKK